MQPPGIRGKKVYIFGPGHMTKMGAMPKYGKNLKKSSYPEPLVDCLETWSEASNLIMHQNLTLWNSRGHVHLVTLAKGHISCL